MSRAFAVSAFQNYAGKLTDALARQDWESATVLADELAALWRDGRRVFICGNGGSAANAIHWANDFLYPVAKAGGKGMKYRPCPRTSRFLPALRTTSVTTTFSPPNSPRKLSRATCSLFFRAAETHQM